MRTPTPSVYIRGLGVYTPERRLTNEELAKQVDTTDEWIRTRSGISERRIAADGENPSDMGVNAALVAIERAGIRKDEIDLIICATMTPDMAFPSTACLIGAKLGLNGVPAFDITAACSGFIYLLQVGNHMLRAGEYRNILIVGTEKLSSIVDWQDRGTCVLFGDAAGAAVLSKCDEPYVGILGNVLGADGSNPELLYCPAGGAAKPASAETVANREHYLRMNGKEIFKLAARVMAASCEKVLEKCGVTSDQVTCFVPHQANIRIIEAVAKQLGIGMDRFPLNLDRYGNTSAASIPLALEEAWRAGRFKKGDYVLLVAFGAGLTWGATLIKWHDAE
jgi:3-oxoacyl-[acyl-carrier-protein] synthase III